jgi:23S rRNA (adenine2503-C2)-methyltransferase
MTLLPDYRAVDRPLAAAPDNLIGLDRQDLAVALGAIGEPEAKLGMRANQLFHWIYHRGATRFADMTSIAKELRERLDAHYRIERPTVTTAERSADGTRKWLVRFIDGNEVESVYIPETDRGALCMSSQVGCALTCSFCHTGTQRLVRNLTAAEIVAQMMLARDDIGEWPTPSDGRWISNIVMMGMGEPLLNYDNVAKALTIMMDSHGIALSKRRITLSTAGIVPMMARCGAELGVNLAVSLHAVRDDLRDILVPINKKHPIAELLAACRAYPGSNNARRITFEYVMLKGINDSASDARELVRLLSGLPAKVNLIPFNPWPGAEYECASPRAMNRFAQIVNDAGYSAPIRVPRGRDIMAACGQLKSASEIRRRGRPAGPATDLRADP